MIIRTDYREEVTITLRPDKGECASDETYVATITALPDTGALYNLSWNYRNHGYAPKLGTQITSVPYTLGVSDHRLLWVAPAYYETTVFQYTVQTIESGGSDQIAVSRTGFVQLLANDNGKSRIFKHEFWTGTMDWTAGTHIYQRTTDVSWTNASMGTYINAYIYSNGGEPDIGMETGNVWYFRSPPSFAGNYLMAYGGYLEFHLKPLAFDITKTRAHPFTFLTLECASCNDGLGRRVAQRHFVPTGNYQQIKYRLSEEEDEGWLLDPKDARTTAWQNPTQCEFLQVLTHLSSIRVYGDLTEGYESIAVDGFEISVGNDDSIIPDPTGCYWTDE